MDLRVPRRKDDFEVLDGVIPHFDVVCDGVVKEDDVLIHHGDAAGENGAVDPGDGLAVKEDLAAPWLIEAGDQL